MKTSTYNNAGPQCPACDFVFTPDEAIYYDSRRYTQDECPDCGQKFNVEVIHSVNWRCRPIEDEMETSR